MAKPAEIPFLKDGQSLNEPFNIHDRTARDCFDKLKKVATNTVHNLDTILMVNIHAFITGLDIMFTFT